MGSCLANLQEFGPVSARVPWQGLALLLAALGRVKNMPFALQEDPPLGPGPDRAAGLRLLLSPGEAATWTLASQPP